MSTPNADIALQPEHLTGELAGLYEALAGAIGSEAALRAAAVIIDIYGGSSIYVPLRASVEREARNAAIKTMYRTHGIRAIAQHFGLADNTVREIVFDRNGRAPQAELEF
jgi:Mor family transcriptional regulator